MRESIWEPNWERAVDRLRECGILNDPVAVKLKKAYRFLRRCEFALRRYENKTVSVLPSSPDDQRKLAIRLGYERFEPFRRDYVDAREAIHALYERRIGNKSL
jgi:glutamine synthetase adenylyltransferase